ncbi:DinB family protein [Flagellimonas sp. GZD32]|uniref:DinB family protein n=1 Tax=Flagellimonas cixiensis TaxID=3228750 RepID=UPI0035C89893
MLRSELPTSEYNNFYHTYILALGDIELLSGLKKGKEDFLSLLDQIPENKLGFAYAEGKWTLAEAIVHIIDTERVFQYRALRFARNDKTDLPGFDQDIYVPNSNASSRSLESLRNEYEAVRDSTLALFSSLGETALLRVGVASGSRMSVRALGFIISGHQAHHARILKERYLQME